MDDFKREGRALSEAMMQRADEKPTLRVGLDLYWTAFSELKSTRAIGMDIGSIPWTAVRLWCDEHRLQGEQREEVFHHIDAMDRAFLEWRARKQESRASKGKRRGRKQPQASAGFSATPRRSGRAR